jgi:hypothetical protein
MSVFEDRRLVWEMERLRRRLDRHRREWLVAVRPVPEPEEDEKPEPPDAA